MPSGRQWLGIGWAPWRGGGRLPSPHFQCIPGHGGLQMEGFVVGLPSRGGRGGGRIPILTNVLPRGIPVIQRSGPFGFPLTLVTREAKRSAPLWSLGAGCHGVSASSGRPSQQVCTAERDGYRETQVRGGVLHAVCAVHKVFIGPYPCIVVPSSNFEPCYAFI